MNKELEFMKMYRDLLCLPIRYDGKLNTKIHLYAEFNNVITALEQKEKLEKVVEILLHKSIYAYAILDTENVSEYNKRILLDDLTEEEYNLLKEIIKDEKK